MLQGAKYFTTLDLMSEYWQVSMEPSSMEKTVFTAYGGLYEFRIMPFGLCNAPGTFQRCIKAILQGLISKIALANSDNVIVFSSIFEQHLADLAIVFQRFRVTNVKLKPSKCKFAQSEVIYVGHVVDAAGIKPDSSKTDMIEKFPVPLRVNDVRSFLGAENYYKRFIKDFARIVLLLWELTKKNVLFVWSDSCQNAFDTLKRALVSAPILAFLDFKLPFYLYVDASLEGIGITLGQIQDKKEVIIAYGGRKLTGPERNYSATEREALVLVEGIRKYQVYLQRKKFYVYTELARLSLLIHFEILYRPGRVNRNADALSRFPYEGPIKVEAFVRASDTLMSLQRRDREMAPLIDYLETRILPEEDAQTRSVLATADQYIVTQEGFLYHISSNTLGSQETIQVVIPTGMNEEVLYNVHDEVTGGHFGVLKTYGKLRKRYHSKNMFADCEHWVKSCPDYNTKKTPKTLGKAPLLPIPVKGPFDRLAVDVLGPFPPTDSGNRYIICFSDMFPSFLPSFQGTLAQSLSMYVSAVKKIGMSIFLWSCLHIEPLL